MVLKLTWYGHSAFGLEVGGSRILIDPFITNNPLAPVSADTLDADYILLTHAHGDHLGDTVDIAKRTHAMVIAIGEVIGWLRKQGLENVHPLNIGGSYALPFGTIKLVQAEHSSSFPDGTYGGEACGIILEADGKRIYFAGDTALFSDMKVIGELEIDLACLPIGGNFTMGPDDALTAINWIHPQAVFPVHYNTFPDIYQDVSAWAQRVNNETSAQAIVVDPGSSFTV